MREQRENVEMIRTQRPGGGTMWCWNTNAGGKYTSWLALVSLFSKKRPQKAWTQTHEERVPLGQCWRFWVGAWWDRFCKCWKKDKLAAAAATGGPATAGIKRWGWGDSHRSRKQIGNPKKQTGSKPFSSSSLASLSSTLYGQSLKWKSWQAEMWSAKSWSQHHKAKYGRLGLELRENSLITSTPTLDNQEI